jgi:hypothetical protein
LGTDGDSTQPETAPPTTGDDRKSILDMFRN